MSHDLSCISHDASNKICFLYLLCPTSEFSPNALENSVPTTTEVPDFVELVDNLHHIFDAVMEKYNVHRVHPGGNSCESGNLKRYSRGRSAHSGTSEDGSVRGWTMGCLRVNCGMYEDGLWDVSGVHYGMYEEVKVSVSAI